jgi:hypothetical protein
MPLVILFLILLVNILLYKTRDIKDTAYTTIIRRYNPIRECFTVSYIKKFLEAPLTRFLSRNETFLPNQLFKKLEFCVAEIILINTFNLIDTNDEYCKIKIRSKIEKIISLYLNIFPNDNKLLIKSLNFRIYCNLMRINCDVYTKIMTLHKMLNFNVNDYISENMLAHKNLFWRPDLEYSFEDLHIFKIFFIYNELVF